MNRPRLHRRYWLLLPLFLAAAVLGWAWSVLHPEIGQPFARKVNGALPDARPALQASGATGAEHPTSPSRPLWAFGFVGDTHAGYSDGTVDQIFVRLQQAGVEFVLHLGDMVDVGASDQEWDQFAALAHAHDLRIMPAVGNHDVHRGYPSDRGEIRMRQYFPQLPETFYSFSHRGLNFVMLNSERVLSPGSEQATFLARQLKSAPGPTFVCLHRPVFTCSRRDRPFMLARRLWLHPRLAESGVLCVLAGHNHYYERTYPLDGVTYVVSGGGSANQYAADEPNRRTARLVAGESHYGVVEVYADFLAVRVLAPDDRQLDAFELPLSARDDARAPSRRGGWSRELPSSAALAEGVQSAITCGSTSPLHERNASRVMPRAW